MAKKIKAVLKLNLPAGQANPAPPVGPALGQHGVAIMDFCKAYNEATKGQAGQIIPAVVTVYEDRSFEFVTKTPPAASLLLKAIKKEKGSSTPHKDKVGRISPAELEKIAQEKMQDLNAKSLDAAIKIIKGTARSMGIEIDG